MKERKELYNLIRRFIAFVLAVLLAFDMSVTGIIRTAVFGNDDGSNMVSAAETDEVQWDVYNDIYLMSSGMYTTDYTERAEAVAYNYFEYSFKGNETYLHNYCHTQFDKRRGLDIIRQEKLMMNKVNELNDRLEGDSRITYDAKNKYTSSNNNGKIVTRQNYFAGGHGFVVKDATNAADTALMPNSLKLGSDGKYTRGAMINDLINGDQSFIDYNISFKVDSISGSNKNKSVTAVLKDSTGYELARKICRRSGETLTMSGSLDVNKINTDKGDGFKYLHLEISSCMATDIRLSNLKFMLPAKETMLEEAYLTNQPIPAGDTAKDGEEHRGKLTYDKSDFDNMYVVLRFDGPVRLSKMLYHDLDLDSYCEKNIDVYAWPHLRAYPRLALATTDASGVEQNTKNNTIFADYCGTMSGVNYSGETVADSCLIFKLDLEDTWRYKSFSIPAISKQVNRTSRDGNMEWINECQRYSQKQKETYNKIFNAGNFKLGETDRMYKGAIRDANGDRIKVQEGFPLQPVAGKDINGRDVKRMPVYDGSVPTIKEVNIHTDNQSGYVKRGDMVDIDVVFNCKLDTTNPTPVFYLNDYRENWSIIPYKNFDPDKDKGKCTVVSGGEYTNARMEPLNVSLMLKEDDTNNNPILDTDEAVPATNTRGAANMTITGLKKGSDYKTYYKVVRESSGIVNIGDTFNPEGWTLYSGEETYLKDLPTALYRDRDGRLERAGDGGFIDICQVKLDNTNLDNNGQAQYTVVKFGESDEINTTSDSESAMKQINNETDSENTVIHYSVPVNGAYGQGDLKLVSCSEDGIYNENTIYYEGTVKNLAGDEMTHFRNFGVFHYDENSNRIELDGTVPQYSNVKYDMDCPWVKAVTIDDACSDDQNAVSKVTYEIDNDGGLCKSSLKSAALKVGKVSEKVHIKVTVTGRDNPEFNGVIDPAADNYDENYSRLIPIDVNGWNGGEVVVEASKADTAGTGKETAVTVPLTLEGYDAAYNYGSDSCELKLLHPYIETKIYNKEWKEPVVRKYLEDADSEEPGNITLRVVPGIKNSSYDVKNYSIYLLDPSDLGLTRDEKGELVKDGSVGATTVADRLDIDYDTLQEKVNAKNLKAYKLEELEDMGEATDDNGGFKDSEYTLACRYLTGDETKNVKIGLSYVNGMTSAYNKATGEYDHNESCGAINVSFEVPVRTAFDKIAYIVYYDEINNLNNIVNYDVRMDTSDAGAYESFNINESDYTEKFVEYTKVNNDDVNIDFVPDSYLEDGSGRLKRSNSYKFRIRSTTDIYWNAGNWNFMREDGMPNNGRTIGGKLQASEEHPIDIIFDTAAIPLEYLKTPEEGGLSEEVRTKLRKNGIIYSRGEGADKKEYIKLSVGNSANEYLGVFGGSAWMWKCSLMFAPYSKKITKYYKHHVTFDADGNVTGDEVTEYQNEDIGDYVMGAGKNYRLDMLDEDFVKRSSRYVDLTSQYGNSYNSYGTNSNNNRLFLEFDSRYNSLNGYSSEESEFCARACSIVKPVTLVLGEEASQLIDPNTDIDFANSYIEIWPVEKKEECSAIYDYQKVGDKPVRTIPLPNAFREVTADFGYAGEYDLMGITVDINAYIENETEDGNGNKVKSYTLPEDGTYAAFANIATYLTDKNGDQVVITSKDHYSGFYKNQDDYRNKLEQDNADEMEQVEVPLAVYAYDQTAPDYSVTVGEKKNGTITLPKLRKWVEDNNITINYQYASYDEDDYDRFSQGTTFTFTKEEYVEFCSIVSRWSDETGHYVECLECLRSNRLAGDYTYTDNEEKELYGNGMELQLGVDMHNEPKYYDDNNLVMFRYAFVNDDFIDKDGYFINDKLDDIVIPTTTDGLGNVCTPEEMKLRYSGPGEIDPETDEQGRSLYGKWGYKWSNSIDEFKIVLPNCEEGCDHVYLVTQLIDAAGNESGFNVKKFVIDVEGPSAKLYSVIKPNKDDPEDGTTEKKLVRAAGILDNFSSSDEITVTKETVNGTDNALNQPVLLKSYSKWIGVDDTFSITIKDAMGNESVITLTEDTAVYSPLVTASASGTDASGVTIASDDDIDTAGLKSRQTGYTEFKDICYEGDTANNTLEFELNINSHNNDGYAPTVEYAFSSDTYKQLYSENPAADTEDYTNMWQEGAYEDVLPDKAAGNGIVNLVYSQKENAAGEAVDDKYTARVNILLPAGDTERNYVITFRFGNGTGMYVYKTVGYRVPALPDGNKISFTPDGTTNAQTLIFNEPLRITGMDAGDNDTDSTEYTTSSIVFFDNNGKYTVNYIDLLGREGSQTLEMTGFDKSWVPDVEKTYSSDSSDGDELTIVLDSGYKGALGMEVTEDAETEVEQSVGKDAAVTLIKKRECLINDKVADKIVNKVYSINIKFQPKPAPVPKFEFATKFAVSTPKPPNINVPVKLDIYSNDKTSDTGCKLEKYTYVAKIPTSAENTYDLSYSRSKSTTDSSNKYDPVSAHISIPEGAEILSEDGDSHTFTENGTYNFTVKYADGVIADIPATVDCIAEREPESISVDNVAPVINGINYYIRNDEETYDITDKATTEGIPEEAGLTNSKVYARLQVMDTDTDGVLNPLTVTLTGNDALEKKVVQDENDPCTLIFNANATAEVVIEDPAGNKTDKKFITVSNITDKQTVTGKIRYVRCGLTQTKAYIDMPEGVSLRDMNGIQTLPKTGADTGKFEYYHLFTQSGTYTFKLTDGRGNVADITTRKVEVDREPLILTEEDRNPVRPGWGESQTVTVSSNLPLKKVRLYNSEGEISDMTVYAKESKAYINFTRNETVRLTAEAENGSTAEITVSGMNIKKNPNPPDMTLTKEYVADGNKYKITAKAVDSIPAGSYDEDCDIHIEPPKGAFEISEGELKKESDPTTMVLTRETVFYVAESGTYTVRAYNMASGENNGVTKSVEVELDKTPPQITVTEDTAGSNALQKAYKVSINEDGFITYAGERNDADITVDESGNVTSAVKSGAVKKDEEFECVIDRNGTFTITATDISGNETGQELRVEGLDEKAPEIAGSTENITINKSDITGSDEEAKITALKNILTEYFEVLDDVSAPEEITKNIRLLGNVIDTSIVQNGTYSAEVEAVDRAGRKSRLSFIFTVTGVEIRTYPELKEFGVNGTILKENGYVSTDTAELTFSGKPDKAAIYYAAGDYTGAQMKYNGTKLDGLSFAAEKGNTYTIMLKLKDQSIHIYHVIIR